MFDDLCHLLNELGFQERTRGSHHIFTKTDVDEIVNIQPKGNRAKPYQVRQIRDLIIRYALTLGEE